jgi:hypothetical protein
VLSASQAALEERQRELAEAKRDARQLQDALASQALAAREHRALAELAAELNSSQHLVRVFKEEGRLAKTTLAAARLRIGQLVSMRLSLSLSPY